MRNPLKWPVLIFNVNINKIETYNVLAYRMLDIKKMKKESENFDEFSKKLDRAMMSLYWSRSEYELILERKDNKLFLKPWVGSRNVEAATIEVTDEEFWQEFSCGRYVNWWGNEAKIDVYDQLISKWDEFARYCWTTHLPYERKRKD
jgi:hypothetical protein